MRVGIYARISTNDKDQNLQTQLQPLAEYVEAQGWTLAGTWTDEASAMDLKHRTGWKALLNAASKRRVDLILVHRLDRAFRSVSHAVTTLEQLRRWRVGLRSFSEAWLDTSGENPVSDLIFNVLASVAQFERSLIASRVRAGMARARREGKTLGRPRAINGEWAQVEPLLASGQLSQSEAARRLGVSRTTVYRLLQNGGGSSGSQGPAN